MKRIAAVCALALMSIASHAQSGSREDAEEMSKYRDSGYKGGVSISQMLYGPLLCVGLETEHGIILNDSFFFGAGASANWFYMDIHAAVYSIFADFQIYTRFRESTPTIGFKAGYADFALLTKTYSPMFEPNVGWSWGIQRGMGINLNLGAQFFPAIDPDNGKKGTSLITPKLSVGIVF